MPIPKKITREVPKTAKERVYTELRSWIINGTLKPEEKLSDQEISQYFSVSRTPVREAIQLLSDQKLVDIYPGRETRVAPIDLKNAGSNYKIAGDLHAIALEFAYPKLTPETISELKKINTAFAQANRERNIEHAYSYDSAFHGIFINLADNYFLAEFLKILGSHIQRIENLYYNVVENYTDSPSEHEQIITALEHHDLPSAMNTMRYNWLHTLEIIDTHVVGK